MKRVLLATDRLDLTAAVARDLPFLLPLYTTPEMM
jgi:hypothetical protein